MTRDEIIKMAREADLIDFRDEDDDPHTKQMVEFLQRFATLVAAAERNRTWTKEHWTEYERSIAAAEREACALICDDIETDRWALFKGREPYTGKEADRGSNYVQGESDGAGKCADTIRARSNT